MDPITKALNAAGGPAKLAKCIGVSPQFISQILKGERPFPAKRCGAVEELTDGAVTRYDLRPDIFGTAPKAHAA